MTRSFFPALFGSLLLLSGSPRAADTEAAIYTLDVTNVSAKVGEPVTMVATLRLHEGYRILHSYNNRVGQLSSFDGAVAFAQKAVPATEQDGTLVFAIALSATQPGQHPINGVVRFGYVEENEGFSMISVPLIATVNGLK